MFLFEEWFWRGTQSAIFYYGSCTPYHEYQYGRRRKAEAARAQKARDALAETNKELASQPVAFETNEEWLEEILAGPGPPKGWAKDPLYYKHARQYEKKNGAYRKVEGMHLPRRLTLSNAATPDKILETAVDSTSLPPTASRNDTTVAQNHQLRPAGSSQMIEGDDLIRPSIDVYMDESIRRPPIDRRISAAVYDIKNTLKTSLRPNNWNLKRYQREDEILEGFNEALLKLWDKVTGKSSAADSTPTKYRHKGKQVDERSAAQKKWERGYNPAINDLHPPVVSQLPATREEAHWMLLPPPSAAVMAGKSPPSDDLGIRRPICIIGRPPALAEHVVDDTVLAESNTRDSEGSPRTRDSTDSEARTPPLSPQLLGVNGIDSVRVSGLDHSDSDDWSDSEYEYEQLRRRSAPVSMTEWNITLKVPQRALIKEGTIVLPNLAVPEIRSRKEGDKHTRNLIA